MNGLKNMIRKKNINLLFILFLFFQINQKSIFGNSLKSPIDFNNPGESSVTEKNVCNKKSENFLIYPFIFLIKFYQNILSPIKGENCRMYPSCSQYSIEAFKKKGFIGILKTVDRLNRCGHDMNNYECIILGNEIKYMDLQEDMVDVIY